MEGLAHVIDLLGSLLKTLEQQLAEKQAEVDRLQAENKQLAERWRAAPTESNDQKAE